MHKEERAGHGDCISTCMDVVKMVASYRSMQREWVKNVNNVGPK